MTETHDQMSSTGLGHNFTVSFHRHGIGSSLRDMLGWYRRFKFGFGYVFCRQFDGIEIEQAAEFPLKHDAMKRPHPLAFHADGRRLALQSREG